MKRISHIAVIGIVIAVFAVAVLGGVLSGYLIKKHRQMVLATPVVDISRLKVIKDSNTQDATYYVVEGITATTGTGDPVSLTIHKAEMSFAPDNNGSFLSVPSNADGTYTISAINTRRGVKSKDLEISGFYREPWDPTSVPTIDVSRVRVSSVVGINEYHYTITGIGVTVKAQSDVSVYIKNKDNGDILPAKMEADGTWSVPNVPATVSGTYLVYGCNVSDETVSESVPLNKFPIIKRIETPSPSQLEQMYRDGNYDRYNGCFRQGYSFVFTGGPIIGLTPHTNQEICTQLRIHAWDDVKVVKVDTDCIGRIVKLYVRVVNS